MICTNARLLMFKQVFKTMKNVFQSENCNRLRGYSYTNLSAGKESKGHVAFLLYTIIRLFLRDLEVTQRDLFAMISLSDFLAPFPLSSRRLSLLSLKKIGEKDCCSS